MEVKGILFLDIKICAYLWSFDNRMYLGILFRLTYQRILFHCRKNLNYYSSFEN